MGNDSPHRRTAAVVFLTGLFVLLIILALPPFALFPASAPGMLQLHLLMELFSITISLMVAAVL
ncbi:MAG: hypothetical protein MO853_10095 [Candidatus Protistobacter heckmanni]|nr:hypothetical protein [Candidatus Protistobacter heckmanni]